MKSRITKLLSLATTTLALAFATGCAPATTAADGSAEAGMSPIVMVGYVVFLFAAMYFLMIRPEKKRKKKAEDMRNSISVGDEITTIGGIVGKIVHVKNDFIVIETGEDRVRIELAKWAIGTTGKAADQTKAQ